MSNSGFIAAMGSVAAAIFFIAAVLCGMANPQNTATRIMFVIALLLSVIYLSVSLFWGVRATSLESFEVAKKKD